MNDKYQNFDSREFQQSLALIVKAIQGEKEDELLYSYLLSVAPSQENKDIILSIREDESKHHKMFKKMYQNITGQEVSGTNKEVFQKPISYVRGIQQAHFRKLKAVEMSQKIRKGLPTRYYRDKMFEIITDKLKHANKYSFLYTENKMSAPAQQLTSKEKTPDEWVKYTAYLVEEAEEDFNKGVNLTHVFQEFILMGVLVGKGYTPKQAYETVGDWEKKGESKLLQASKKFNDHK